MKINGSHFIYEDKKQFIFQKLFNIYDLEENILNDSLLYGIIY